MALPEKCLGHAGEDKFNTEMSNVRQQHKGE